MAHIARPVSEVLKDIFDNAQEIVRSEAKLAKAELYEEVGKSKRAAAWLAAAALAAIFAVGFLLVGAFLVLHNVTRDWVAASIIAAVCSILCALCLTVAQKNLDLGRSPTSSAGTRAKEFETWAKQSSK
ncbi:MAG TPA: phage holin family protein [Steroidobacteraceae bacterium]|jgi:sugar phosphate permease